MLRIVNLVLAAAVMVGAAGLYAVKTDARRLEAQVQAQERTHERLIDDIAVLSAERAYLARPERLEKFARQIGLQPLHERQLIRLDGLTPPAALDGQNPARSP
jgi:cell division protein FtsL